MSESENISSLIIKRTITRGIVLLVLSLVLIVSLFPPVEAIDYLFYVLTAGFNVAPEVFLMVIDLLLLLAGYWLASAVYSFLYVGKRKSNALAFVASQLSSLNRTYNRRGLVSLTIAAAIIIICHVPAILDATLLSFELHLIMHTLMLLAGFMIFTGFRMLSPNMRLLTYLLGCKGMAIFGALLIVSPAVVYGSYPYYEQAETGAAMIAMCIASDATVIPIWLRRYFTKR